MLCNKCEQVFRGDSPATPGFHDAHPFFRHHENVNMIEISARQGCHICALIMRTIRPDEIEIVRPPAIKTPGLSLGSYEVFVTIKLNEKYHQYASELEVFLTYPPALNARYGHNIPVNDRKVSLRLFPAEAYKNDLNTGDFGSSTRSDQTWVCVMSWLEQCKQFHRRCSSTNGAGSWKPTRLLDLGPLGTNLSPRLVEHHEIPVGITYVTLSHCWGKAEVFRLLTQNLESMKNHVPMNHLSRTFQNAIEITRRLSIRYLWIDSLCIIQDSKDDWEIEASQMEQVYKNSYFNIAATQAADGRGGLFVERDTDLIRPYKVTATWNGEEPVEFFITEDLDEWVRKFNLEPLITRAWVVQERLLAPRICHFTSTEVIWECNELWACERIPATALESNYYLPATKLPSGSFSSLSLDSPNLDFDARDCWVQIVGVYSRSNLTRETDRLAAISGIARKMQGFLRDDYLAGMWRKNLEYQLLWTINPIEMTRNQLPPSKRSAQYIAPTWSWASVNGTEVILSVAWTFSSTQPTRADKALLAQVIDVGVTPANNAILCEDGFLHLRCFLIPVTPHSLTKTTCVLHYNNGEFQQEEIPFCFTTVDTLVTDPREFSFWCAPILHDRLFSGSKGTCLQGLLLYRHKSDRLCFRRCGLFSLNNAGSDDLDRFWKGAYHYGKSALLTQSLESEPCTNILTYKMGSGGINYKRRSGIPQFKIIIK